jgi:hypothetical protein
MPEPDQTELIVGRVRVLQIVMLAMATGFVLFLVIILAVPGFDRPLAPEGSARIVTYIAAGYGALALMLAPLVSGTLVSAGRKRIARALAIEPRGENPNSPGGPLQGTAAALAHLCVAKTLLSAALYEGAGLFLAVSYMLGRSPLALIAAAVLLAALLWHLPTTDRVQRWIEEQLRKIEQDRSLTG